MHHAFFSVMVIVAVLGIAVSLTALAWPFAVMRGLGRTGDWIHHEDMDSLETQPDGNLNDPAITHRPLRGRG